MMVLNVGGLVSFAWRADGMGGLKGRAVGCGA